LCATVMSLGHFTIAPWVLVLLENMRLIPSWRSITYVRCRMMHIRILI
jgi:hypothetical protein